jgi:hypothetical protein
LKDVAQISSLLLDARVLVGISVLLLLKLAEVITEGSLALPLARAYRSEGLLAQTGRCTEGLWNTMRPQRRRGLSAGRSGESRNKTIDPSYRSKRKSGDRMDKSNNGKK